MMKALPILDWKTTTRSVTVDKKFNEMEIFLGEDFVAAIVREHIRKAYSLTDAHEIEVSILDVTRSEDAALVTIRIEAPE